MGNSEETNSTSTKRIEETTTEVEPEPTETTTIETTDTSETTETVEDE